MCGKDQPPGMRAHMFFLLRMTFWLGLVLVLLPIGSAQQNSPGKRSQRHRGNFGRLRDGRRLARLLLTSTRRLFGRLAGGDGDRLPRAGRSEDALRSVERSDGAARDRIGRQPASQKYRRHEIGRRQIRGRTAFAEYFDAGRSGARLARAAAAQGQQARRLNARTSRRNIDLSAVPRSI